MHGKRAAFTLALEQPPACGLLHIASSPRDICQLCPYEKQQCYQQPKKISSNLKWPHKGEILIPGSFSNSNRKVSVLHTGETCHFKAKFHKNTPVWLCAERTITATPINSLSQNNICCPSASLDHLLSISRFSFTNKTHICWKSHYILCLQGYCIHSFLLYQTIVC